MVERVSHVAIALVPRARALAEHRAVVLLGVGDDRRVLLGEELLVLGHETVVREVLAGVTTQFHELFDHASPARLAHAQEHRVTVCAAVLRVWMQALIAFTSAAGRLWIVLVEIVDHGVHRCAHAVEVKAIEADVGRGVAEAHVVGAQPTDEVEHIGVAPHPGGKAREAAQGLLGVGVGSCPADMAVDALGVGPVTLDGDGSEAKLADQPLGYACALAVELVRAVAGLAQQHDPCVADQRQQRIVIVAISCQRQSLLA